MVLVICVLLLLCGFGNTCTGVTVWFMVLVIRVLVLMCGFGNMCIGVNVWFW